MHRAVRNFAENLNTISDTIKQRTVHQIKAALQKKAYDEAGIAVHSVTSTQPSNKLMQSKLLDYHLYSVVSLFSQWREGAGGGRTIHFSTSATFLCLSFFYFKIFFRFLCLEFC